MEKVRQGLKSWRGIGFVWREGVLEELCWGESVRREGGSWVRWGEARGEWWEKEGRRGVGRAGVRVFFVEELERGDPGREEGRSEEGTEEGEGWDEGEEGRVEGGRGGEEEDVLLRFARGVEAGGEVLRGGEPVGRVVLRLRAEVRRAVEVESEGGWGEGEGG